MQALMLVYSRLVHEHVVRAWRIDRDSNDQHPLLVMRSANHQDGVPLQSKFGGHHRPRPLEEHKFHSYGVANHRTRLDVQDASARQVESCHTAALGPASLAADEPISGIRENLAQARAHRRNSHVYAFVGIGRENRVDRECDQLALTPRPSPGTCCRKQEDQHREKRSRITIRHGVRAGRGPKSRWCRSRARSRERLPDYRPRGGKFPSGHRVGLPQPAP